MLDSPRSSISKSDTSEATQSTLASESELEGLSSAQELPVVVLDAEPTKSAESPCSRKPRALAASTRPMYQCILQSLEEKG